MFAGVCWCGFNTVQWKRNSGSCTKSYGGTVEFVKGVIWRLKKESAIEYLKRVYPKGVKTLDRDVTGACFG